MSRRDLLYLPLTPVAFAVFLVATSLLIATVASTTGQLLGFTPLQTVVAFVAIVTGSGVNIPVKRLKGEKRIRVKAVTVFGIPYPVPSTETQETILAVNLGGAVVPVIISTYLIVGIGPLALLAAGLTILLTALVTNAAAKPVRGLGIVVSPVVPAFASAAGAILSIQLLGLPLPVLPRIAFSGGVLGALVGADLMNLDEISKLGSPVASIGGAGTFDGILITGVTAVMLGALVAGI